MENTSSRFVAFAFFISFALVAPTALAQHETPPPARPHSFLLDASLDVGATAFPFGSPILGVQVGGDVRGAAFLGEHLALGIVLHTAFPVGAGQHLASLRALDAGIMLRGYLGRVYLEGSLFGGQFATFPDAGLGFRVGYAVPLSGRFAFDTHFGFDLHWGIVPEVAAGIGLSWS